MALVVEACSAKKLRVTLVFTELLEGIDTFSVKKTEVTDVLQHFMVSPNRIVGAMI